MVDKKNLEHTPAKPSTEVIQGSAQEPKEDVSKETLNKDLSSKEVLPKTSSPKESSSKNTAKETPNDILKGQRKKRYSWQIGLLIIVGGVLSLQSYVVYTLIEKITTLEEVSLHAQNLKQTLSALDGKINALEKNALSKITSLHEKMAEQPDQHTIQAPLMSEEQFQHYTLGSKQLDAIKQDLSNTFQEKGDGQEKLLLQSQALIYFNYLQHAVQNGESYIKLFDVLKHMLATDHTSTRPLTTAFDILSLSASSGLANYNELYKFPEDVVLMDEQWPSWLLWVKDYVSFKANTPKGINFQEKQRLMQLLDTRQIQRALELVTQHTEGNLEMKASWSAWLKVAETRVKVQQSLDTIQHFLLEHFLLERALP